MVREVRLVRGGEESVASIDDVLGASRATKTPMLRKSTMLAALSLTLAATACSDPAEGKPKAKVEEADAKAAAKPGAKTDAQAASGAKFEVDAAASKLGFVGSKVTGSHDGGFKKFTATAALADGKVEGGNVSVEIDVSSMFTDSDKLTGHLKSADFFDAEGNPTATFSSSKIAAGAEGEYGFTVEGNLTLRGVTKKITFPANIETAGDKVTVKSEFSIDRKDFEMKYAGMPDDLIRDDVLIKLDLAFNKA